VNKSLIVASLVATLACAPAAAQDQARKKPHASQKAKAKSDNGPSCKAPAVATCAACHIACRPGETATCIGGQVSGDICTAQPSCRCR
jgi:cytochrome c553